MVKFEDLKVGMCVKLKKLEECEDRDRWIHVRYGGKEKYCDKVVKIKTLDSDESFEIEECEGFFCIEWVESIVNVEKMLKIENLKPGMKVKLKKIEECNETDDLRSLRDFKGMWKFADQIVTISKVDKRKIFKILDDDDYYLYSPEWIEKIVNSENNEQDEKVENMQNIENNPIYKNAEMFQKIMCFNIKLKIREMIRLMKRDLSEKVYEQLLDSKHEWLLFGGAVRDWMLGGVPRDYDIVTSKKLEYCKPSKSSGSISSKSGKVLTVGKFDIWGLSEHFIKNIPNLHEITKTTTLNINGIGILMKGDKFQSIVISENFENFLELGEIKIVNYDNMTTFSVPEKLYARMLLISEKLNIPICEENKKLLKCEVLKDEMYNKVYEIVKLKSGKTEAEFAKMMLKVL